MGGGGRNSEGVVEETPNGELTTSNLESGTLSRESLAQGAYGVVLFAGLVIFVLGCGVGSPYKSQGN